MWDESAFKSKARLSHATEAGSFAFLSSGSGEQVFVEGLSLQCHTSSAPIIRRIDLKVRGAFLEGDAWLRQAIRAMSQSMLPHPHPLPSLLEPAPVDFRQNH